MNFWHKWKGATITKLSPREVHQRLQAQSPPLILDVRQGVEIQSGMIPGARHIPLTQLSQRLAEIPRDRPVICVCYSNHRSPIAARLLAKAGYEVLDMREGMLGWARAGLPLSHAD